MLDLAIITGASRGIGSQIFSDCVKYCSRTIGVASSFNLEQSAKSSKNDKVVLVKADLAKYKLAEYLLKKKIFFSKVNPKIGIILCASQLGKPGGIFNADFRDWERLFRINLLGNLKVIKTVLNLMPSKAQLRIVFFAGGGAAYGYPDFFGYALTKVSTVRAVENLGIEFAVKKLDASIIALAPGAVETDMLKKVINSGGFVKTRTEMKEPVNFVRRFLIDEVDSIKLNGRFVHVRDKINSNILRNLSESKFKLRRSE